MSPSRPFILRPVATALLMVAIFLVGAVAYIQLPVSALPEVDYPTIQVVTFYPGASPDVVSTTVTAPLERQFGQMPGLSQMTSSSSGGTSVVVLQFNLSLNIDVAEQEVQSAINAAQSLLPANLPAPPIYSKTNPADAPVLTLAITSDSIPLPQVEDLVDTRLAPKIAQLTGVGLVSIGGGQKPAVRIQANPTALSSYGINMEDLRTALTQNSVNAAKGNFDGLKQDFQIDANDQLVTSKDYRNVVGRFSQRRAGHADRRGESHGRRRERGLSRVDEPDSRGYRQRPAPAGGKYHHGRQKHQGAPAAVGSHAAGGRQGERSDRSDDEHQRVGERRKVRVAADHRAGGHGHFPVLAQPARDHYSERRSAALAGGHLRGDVRPWLQLGQSCH